MLSTQFEFPRNYDIQVEVDAGEWYAQMTLTDVTLSRTKLTIDGVAEGISGKLVIHFMADEDDFDELVRVVRIMMPSVDMLR